MKEKFKKYWREIVIGILILLCVGMIGSKSQVKEVVDKDSQQLIVWQGQKIQDLQKQIEDSRIIPKEFISKESFELWVSSQDIGLNLGWTLELVQKLQQQAFNDGCILMYIPVVSQGTMQNEYWPITWIKGVLYYIEPLNHDVKEWKTSGSEIEFKIPDIKIPKLPDINPKLPDIDIPLP